MRIFRGPGSAFGSMFTSANSQVPAWLTVTGPASRPGEALSMRAPARLRPLTITRTGLIEWPGHQLGGSTLIASGRTVLAGGCARVDPARHAAKKRTRRGGFIGSNLHHPRLGEAERGGSAAGPSQEI